MYKIGMFSKMNRVTVKTLRHYEDVGLLKPAYVDEATGYRYYTSDQLPALHQIRALRQIGFSLDEIAAVQSGASPQQILSDKKLQLIEEISSNTLKLSQIEHYLQNQHEEETMNYEVVIKEIPEVTVASRRMNVESYDSFFSVVPECGKEMNRLGCVCAQPEYCFTIFHDGEYKETDIDVEICEAVVEAKENTDIITFRKVGRIPEAACVLHRGPYRTIGNAYAALTEWASANGYEIVGFPRESYIDGIWNKGSDSEWLTEIQFPVKKL